MNNLNTLQTVQTGILDVNVNSLENKLKERYELNQQNRIKSHIIQGNLKHQSRNLSTRLGSMENGNTDKKEENNKHKENERLIILTNIIKKGDKNNTTTE
jgi:hypothetical protein